MQPIVKIMKFDSEIMSTFSIFKLLSPHLTQDIFLKKVNRLQDNYGFNLGTVIDNNNVTAAAAGPG
jgi:hypothetical protein